MKKEKSDKTQAGQYNIHDIIYRFDSSKNWTEDYKLENGNYMCKCSLCNEYFFGYKRRVICKECAKKHIVKMKNIDQLPEIGKSYNCYDDGKIYESRRIQVYVFDLILFEKAPKNIKKEWSKNVKKYHWVFDKKTDYFIIADTEEKHFVYARSLWGGWFCVKPCGSNLLDVSGNLTKNLIARRSGWENYKNMMENENEISEKFKNSINYLCELLNIEEIFKQ